MSTRKAYLISTLFTVSVGVIVGYFAGEMVLEFCGQLASRIPIGTIAILALLTAYMAMLILILLRVLVMSFGLLSDTLADYWPRYEKTRFAELTRDLGA